MASAPRNTPLRKALHTLASGERLGEALCATAFRQMTSGSAPPAQVGALLMGLRVRGETADEVVGAVRALREVMVSVPVEDRSRLIDTCGTGGGAVSTFNISTAAALVAVGAGAVVAKHGNRSYTSKCGSADLLEALGLEIALDARRAAHLLRAVKIAFLFAPAFHPAIAAVTPVRRELGVPTIMNLVGPLLNPAGVTRQVIGVWDGSRAPLVAEVLARLGAEHALVVHARVGMDEIAPVGDTDVWEVRAGEVRGFAVQPAAYGLERAVLTGLAGGDPATNAERLSRLLESPRSDQIGRAAVALNAGAALYVAGVADSLAAGVEGALAALDDGAGASTLERLRKESGVNTSG